MAIPDFLIFYEQNQGLFKEESEYVSYVQNKNICRI